MSNDASPKARSDDAPIHPGGNVYQLMCEASAIIGKSGGVGKDKTVEGKNYKYRSIDGVMNGISSVLSAVGLVIAPRYERHSIEEVTISLKLGPQKNFRVIVCAEFDFISKFDGSTHAIKTFGEAMDQGDKATNKAMALAYKYAVCLALCIPTEGIDDGESDIYGQEPLKNGKPKNPPVLKDTNFEQAAPAFLERLEKASQKGVKVLMPEQKAVIAIIKEKHSFADASNLWAKNRERLVEIAKKQDALSAEKAGGVTQ